MTVDLSETTGPPERSWLKPVALSTFGCGRPLSHTPAPRGRSQPAGCAHHHLEVPHFSLLGTGQLDAPLGKTLDDSADGFLGDNGRVRPFGRASHECHPRRDYGARGDLQARPGAEKAGPLK